MLHDIRDRVIANAEISGAARVADVGCGDGLVGLRILETHPEAGVTFIDVSPELIDRTRDIARRRGMLERCRFVVSSAETLPAVATASVDVVTIRAVLPYLADKRAALAECYRILRPGGRLSLADPIFADQAYVLAGIAGQLRSGTIGAAHTYFEFLHRCRSAHLPDTIEGIRTNPLTAYSERDLVNLSEAVGFTNVHLRLHIDVEPAVPVAWNVYLQTSPRAGVPPYGELLATLFSAAERLDFERLFRPAVEAGTHTERNTNAYVFAVKPPPSGSPSVRQL